MENSHSSERVDIETIRSRRRELSEILRSCNDFTELSSSSESVKIFKDFFIDLERKIKQITSESSDFSSLGLDDLDAYVEHAKEELNLVEAENSRTSNEIEVHTRTYIEDATRLESNLEGLNYSLQSISSQGLDEVEMDASVEGFISTENQGSSYAHQDYNFELLELDHEIEKNKATLSSLHDLDYTFKRIESVGKIEDTLMGLKVIEFEGNCIKLLLKTYVPTLEGLLCQQKMEYATDPFAVDHELFIELMDGTMELKNAEIFPNDVFIGEIIDAAKALRQYCPLSVSKPRSSLEWVVRKVQHQIILSTLRKLLVKDANNSRHWFEYSDRDATITAHMVGGIDAFIKIPQSWPVLNSALKLVSLNSSSENHSKGISLSFLCKVEELVNSLDVQTRQNLSSFADAIEEILVQQMRSERQSGHISELVL